MLVPKVDTFQLWQTLHTQLSCIHTNLVLLTQRHLVVQSSPTQLFTPIELGYKLDIDKICVSPCSVAHTITDRNLSFLRTHFNTTGILNYLQWELNEGHPRYFIRNLIHLLSGWRDNATIRGTDSISWNRRTPFLGTVSGVNLCSCLSGYCSRLHPWGCLKSTRPVSYMVHSKLKLFELSCSLYEHGLWICTTRDYIGDVNTKVTLTVLRCM